MERSYLKINNRDGTIERATDVTADDVIAANDGRLRLLEITNPGAPTECVGGGQWRPISDAA